MLRRLSQKTGTALGNLAKLVLIGMAAYFVANSYGAARTGPADLIGKPAPLFTGETMTGEVVNLEELKDRVVVVDFWATWCPPCRQAIPKVQAVSRRFENDPVTVLGLNLDQEATPEQIAEFLKKYEITFSQILDPVGNVKKKYGVRGIPCSIVIDKKGIVRNVHLGYNSDLEEKLGEHVAGLL